MMFEWFTMVLGAASTIGFEYQTLVCLLVTLSFVGRSQEHGWWIWILATCFSILCCILQLKTRKHVLVERDARHHPGSRVHDAPAPVSVLVESEEHIELHAEAEGAHDVDEILGEGFAS